MSRGVIGGELARFPFNPDVYRAQMKVVWKFVMHVAAHRALLRPLQLFPQNIPSTPEILKLSCNANFLQAVILWCIVFGARSNKVHWKKLGVPDQHEAAYMEGIAGATGMSQEEHDTYNAQLRDFRDSYAAHASIQTFNKPLPDLEPALQIAFYWDEWVRTAMEGANFEFPLLRDDFPKFQAAAHDQVDAILKGLARPDEQPLAK